MRSRASSSVGEVSPIVVVGLGNPGARYAQTRHNIGALAVKRAAVRFDVDEWRQDGYAQAATAEGIAVSGTPVQFVLPQTYMNRSGDSLRVLCAAEGACANMVVVHDDIDLPEGVVRVVYGRGHGGHNGVRSLESALGTRAFTRVRIGVLPIIDGVVRKPSGEGAVSAFVLKECSKEVWLRMEEYAARAAQALELIIEEGRDAAMRECNVREKQEYGGVTHEQG